MLRRNSNITLANSSNDSLEQTKSNFLIAYGTQQTFFVEGHRQDSSLTTIAHDTSTSKQTTFCFPQRLFEMLKEIDGQGDAARFSSIISWHITGMAFVIHKPEDFVRLVMPVFFRTQSKLTSFQRQLNNYGFHRIQERRGNISLTFYHKLFVRDEPDLCQTISLHSKIPKKKRAFTVRDTIPNATSSSNERRLELFLKTMEELPWTTNSNLCSKRIICEDLLAPSLVCSPFLVEGDPVLDEAVAEIYNFEDESQHHQEVRHNFTAVSLYNILAGVHCDSTDGRNIWDPDIECLEAFEEI